MPQAELYRELREAKERAAAAEAAARDMEGALAQYEATLAAAISANSTKQTQAAGKVGLLEAQVGVPPSFPFPAAAPSAQTERIGRTLTRP